MNYRQLFIFIILAVLLPNCSTFVSSSSHSTLEVVAIDAIGIPTHIYSVGFNFRITSIEKLASGLEKYWTVGDTLTFRMRQGADFHDGKDAIGRLTNFLRASFSKSTTPNTEGIYTFEETRPLRLEVIHAGKLPIGKYGGWGVWTLTNAEGNSVSINTSH